jgi:hypothetical protein
MYITSTFVITDYIQFLQIWVSRFYRGIAPNLLKNIPASSITFIVYGNVLRLLKLARKNDWALKNLPSLFSNGMHNMRSNNADVIFGYWKHSCQNSMFHLFHVLDCGYIKFDLGTEVIWSLRHVCFRSWSYF